ncbi:hypothetical protein F4777DRAFT_582750 [Nemania sp. FL0916]|nr:hypothetical protein F4777DRAFT_582750 [Nemania sp. FL0916]
MDALKKVIGGEQKQGEAQQQGNPAGQKDDYGDKGAEYVNKTYLSDKLSHDQLEKITDSAREGFEKATGKDVPDKFSN